MENSFKEMDINYSHEAESKWIKFVSLIIYKDLKHAYQAYNNSNTHPYYGCWESGIMNIEKKSYDAMIYDSFGKPVENILELIYSGSTVVAKLVIDGATYGAISGFEALKTTREQQNFREFMNNLGLESTDELMDFIKIANDEQKKTLENFILRVKDADNSLNLYIQSMLFLSFKASSHMDYYERSLFSNINSLIKDDFLIYHEIFKEKVLDEESQISYKYEFVWEDTYKGIVIDKFTNLGVLNKLNIAYFDGDQLKKGDYRQFVLTSFSRTLYEWIDGWLERGK